VDGALIEAWASEKSFQRREEPPTSGSGTRGKVLLHDVFGSRTDPEARKFKKSRFGDAKLCHLAHVFDGQSARSGGEYGDYGSHYQSRAKSGDRHTRANGAKQGATVEADKGYDVRQFIQDARKLGITPHVPQFQRRNSSLDARTTRHPDYQESLNRRAQIEQIFSWLKNIGCSAKRAIEANRNWSGSRPWP
jgi:DDE family transposase